MNDCCVKLVDGSTCPKVAMRRITLQANGLVFKVPICHDHYRIMPAKATDASSALDDLLRGSKKSR